MPQNETSRDCIKKTKKKGQINIRMWSYPIFAHTIYFIFLLHLYFSFISKILIKATAQGVQKKIDRTEYSYLIFISKQ